MLFDQVEDDGNNVNRDEPDQYILIDVVYLRQPIAGFLADPLEQGP